MLGIIIVLYILGIAVVLLTALLALEVLSALGAMIPHETPSALRPGLAVLMPAHNESAIIGATIEALLPQLLPVDRLLVVADNCTDDTAGIARSLGATVVVRSDAEHRGKGYALDYGVRSLELDPPQVVIVIDADCRVAPGGIDSLARRCIELNRTLQALYLMHAPPDASTRVQLAAFAWVIKNLVRPLGLFRMGLPCQLMGTGMAFPWKVIQSAELASGNIVEDLKLGLDLAGRGEAAQFYPKVAVTSTFPATVHGLRTQRARWEHGHLATIAREAPRLLTRAATARDIPAAALALDLCVPPLALLAMLAALIWGATVLLWVLAGERSPFILATTAGLLLSFAVLAAWAKFGRSAVSLQTLATAPIYAIVKIPLYARFLIARQIDWVRSKRDTESR